MAGIYERDNINYPSILAAMVQARARSAEREGDTVRKNGEIWSGAVDKLGGIGARTMDYLQAMNESPEARLKKLEEEKRIAEEERAAALAEEQKKLMEGYSKDVGMVANEAKYQGYRPNVVEPKNYGDGAYAVPGMANSTQKDYFDYLRYMNGIYGG